MTQILSSYPVFLFLHKEYLYYRCTFLQATVIRENLKNGVSVEKMINPAVYDYIMKHGLYGVKSSKLEE